MLSHLVFSTTYQCPIECTYCGAEAGPHQTARLTRAEMIGIIDQVAGYGKLRTVVFTGGEPLLLGRDLYDCISYCAGKGLWTRIVTNAYWATTPGSAAETVDRLRAAGLSEINLSCDDYHQEFIPIEMIKYANDACNVAELPCLIGHKVMKGCRITLDYLQDFLGCELARFDPKGNNPKNNLVSTGYTVPVAPDAMDRIPDEDILYPPVSDCWLRPCTSILQRIVITPNRELSICCGMISRRVKEICFGPLGTHSLEELILQAHRDLIVNWLALEGPAGMMRFIREKRPDIPFRKRYVNICHLCGEILTRPECRAVLAEHGHEKIGELTLKRWLYDAVRELDPPSGGNAGEPLPPLEANPPLA